jgi:hypothetical protein
MALGGKDDRTVRLRALLGMFKDSLPEENQKDAEDLISHGEFGEALDLIVTQVYEYELPVSEQAYALVEELGRGMEIDPSSWSFLRELREGS